MDDKAIAQLSEAIGKTRIGLLSQLLNVGQ